MEGIIVIVVIALLAVPVGVIVALVQISGLKDRLRLIEGELRRQKRLVDTMVAPGATPDVATPPPVAAAPIPEPVAPPQVMAPPVAAAAPAGEDLPTPLPPVPPAPPAGPVVFSPARTSALADWLKANWVYAVAAVSLAFAGIFFVQYGMERGLLPPVARVVLAILFGAALIVAGEVVRRRSGDGPKATSAYVPSTFSGAGLVSMFAGVLAARQLYGLIGTGAAMAGLVAIAALAVILGWFYGPFLAAIGLIGAGLAPFVVGGSSDQAYPLYAYFLLIASAGLAIDAIRRWAWISVLALAVGYAGSGLVMLGTGGMAWYGLTLAGLALAAVLIPCLKLQPDQDGPMLAESVVSRGAAGWPIFPARLAAGAVALSATLLTLIPTDNATESLVLFVLLAGLAAALTVWSRGARALSDLALLPAAGFLARLVLEGVNDGPLANDFATKSLALNPPESAMPMTAGLLLAIAAVLTFLTAWRSAGAEYRPHWGAAAALFAPLAAVALDFFWTPAEVIGAYPWALHIIALAGLMAFLAARFAKADGEDRRRAAYATLSCLSLIALALFLILTKAALTLAVAALIPIAAWLDRRFRLPEMGWFIQAAVVALSWRLVIDPGLLWAVDEAQLWEAILAFGGAAAAMIGGLRLLQGLDRRAPQTFLESGAAAALALLANVLITRWLTDGESEAWILSHWAATLNAMPWLILSLTQLYRLQLGGALRWLRIAIASVAGLLALLGIGSAVLPLNPLFGAMAGGREGLVFGPYLLDTLMTAYLLPALLLMLAQARMTHLPHLLRQVMLGAGAALAGLYVALEIRRFWQGDDLSVPGVSQAELYSYTVAMMTLGAGLLYQAIARRSTMLRRAALAVIGVTIAKVFLIDASGLTGLTRVFSFLALGLSLIGLAWLDRWAAERSAEKH